MRAPNAILFLLALGLCACSPLGKRFEPYSSSTVSKEGFETVKLEGGIKPEDLLPSKEPFRLGPGDKLEVEVLHEEGTLKQCWVMPDGKLYYMALQGQLVSNLKVLEVKVLLEKGLREFYKNPQVSVVLRGVSSRRVWILGRVNTPGLYPIESPMTVLEGISKAGGLFTSRFSGTTEELADLRHSFLIRKGEFMPVDFYKLIKEGDLSQNVYLQDGDYVYLPSALSQEVYVMGAVKQPKAIGFSDQVTLVSVIAGAGGLLPGAYAQRAVIVRGSLNEPTVATVNLNLILHGEQPDVALQPRDIVWIPNSPWERIENYAKLIINSFVKTVAANEGTHAASKSGQNVQPSIGIGGSGSK